MKSEFSERLTEARKRAGFTSPRDAARRFGWNENTYKSRENGLRGMPDQPEVQKYAKAFGVNWLWLLANEGEPGWAADGKSTPIGGAGRSKRLPDMTEQGEASPAPSEVQFAGPAFIPRLGPMDVPVLGNAIGGERGDFIMNGEIVGRVRRPAGIEGQKVFAVYISGDSMEPRYHPGELVYVSRTRPAVNGDYVIVEMHPVEDGGEAPGFIKRLVRRTPTTIVCQQYNPPKELTYKQSEVRHVYRVIPFNEVNGV